MAKMHQTDEFDFEFEIETESRAVTPDNVTDISVELRKSGNL